MLLKKRKKKKAEAEAEALEKNSEPSEFQYTLDFIEQKLRELPKSGEAHLPPNLQQNKQENASS